MSGFMNTNDAPSSKLATLYCTVGGRRYAMLNAKNFEAKANVSLADVPILGKTIKGKKPSGLEIKIKMTLYKCTEAFDRLVEEYKNTGMLPTFEAEVESNDPATSMGASGKTYHQCMIEGDVFYLHLMRMEILLNRTLRHMQWTTARIQNIRNLHICNSKVDKEN